MSIGILALSSVYLLLFLWSAGLLLYALTVLCLLVLLPSDLLLVLLSSGPLVRYSFARRLSGPLFSGPSVAWSSLLVLCRLVLSAGPPAACPLPVLLWPGLGAPLSDCGRPHEVTALCRGLSVRTRSKCGPAGKLIAQRSGRALAAVRVVATWDKARGLFRRSGLPASRATWS